MTKTNNRIKIVLLLTAIICLFLGATPLMEYKAEAATTPKYTATFSYTNTKVVVANGKETRTTVGSGSNVTSASVYNDKGSKNTVKINIWGSDSSGTGTLSNGAYINSDTINISITSTTQYHNITVKSGSSTVGQVTRAKTIKLTGLSSGSYSVTIWGYGDGKVSGYTATIYELNCTFSFKLDLNAPTISGGSTSQTGKYVKTSFTISSSDTGGSGIESLYMQQPGGSFQAVGSSSKTVSSSSKAGLYSFYAKDKAGNKSETQYVYLDATPPGIGIYTSDGTKITGSATNVGFYAHASDTGRGVDYMQYKTPGSSSWQSYTAYTVIPNTSTGGTYYFKATDKMGNVSSEYSMCLDTTSPTGQLYSGTSPVSSGSNSTSPFIYYLASDSGSGISACYVSKDGGTYSSYTSGNNITTSGRYTFYCEDRAANISATVNIFLDNVAPNLNITGGSFGSKAVNDFTVSASDDYSGATLYYKAGSAGTYIKSGTPSVSINSAFTDNTYYFYAVDGMNNRSEIKQIEYVVPPPTATILHSDTGNKICAVWTEENCIGTLDGESYTSGTWLTQEKTYHLNLKSTATGRESNYEFTLTHKYEAISVVPPNCTEQGYTKYRCITCGDEYNGDYVAARGHSYNSVVTSPTCLEQGYTTQTCTVCGHVQVVDYVSPLGHNFRQVKVNATCTEQGYTRYICTRCGYSENRDYVAPLGHNYRTTTVNATCTEGGGKKHTCSRCGDYYLTDETDPLGHNFYEEYAEPTCTEVGGVKHICTRCAYTYMTEQITALGHLYETAVINLATCTADGHRSHECSRCGDEYVTVIPCTGHTYEFTDEKTENVIKRRYTCTKCGHSYVQNLGDQYDAVTNYIEFLYEQYSPYMVWTLIGTSGIWSIVMGVFIVIAHKNEDKEKARKMIKNYIIGLIAIFVILLAVPLIARGIAALVT